MAKVGINTGSAANAGDGSTLRAGANIINANFDEIYSYFGDGSTLSFSGGQWVSVNSGINTLSNIGIGTTNPANPLTVLGAANIIGVVTATRFSGILSATDATISGVTSANGNVLVGAGITAYASTGILSASKYYGDGSSLLSVPSGLGTALSDDSTSPLNKIYYVDATMGIGQTVTVDPPSSSQVAFTNFPNVHVESGYDLIVADGDDFIPDILGIGTTGVGGVLSGGGGRVRADNYTNKAGGAANFPEGLVSSGIITATGIGITNFNATGIVTAGSGLKVTAGGVHITAGGVNVQAGLSTFTGIGTFKSDLYVAGALSVTGAITGTASTATAAGTAYGVTGSPNVSVQDVQVGGSCTITGNLTVDGTQTIINTSVLDVADKTVGIASTTAAEDSTADGAGLEIYASSVVANNNKTLTWVRGSGSFEPNVPFKFKGVHETATSSGLSTYLDASNNLVLEMDVQAQTVFSYTTAPGAVGTPGTNIGIVSFKNVPANSEQVTTTTLMITQNSMGTQGTGNTNAQNGIGVTCTIIPVANNAALAGIQTRGKCSSTSAGVGQTVTLSTINSQVDIVSFMIHYNGGNTADLNSYKVYVTKNGGFTFGGVGI